jgi:hypothetical protein
VPAVDPDRIEAELLCRHVIVKEALRNVEDRGLGRQKRASAWWKLSGDGL